MWVTPGMFTSLRGFLGCYYINISGKVQEHCGKCSGRLWGIFKQVLGNVEEDSGECQSRSWAMLIKVPGNLNLDSFCEVVPIFLSNSAVRQRQNKVIKQLLINFCENFLCYQLTNLLRLNTVFLQPFSFLFSLSFYVEKGV